MRDIFICCLVCRQMVYKLCFARQTLQNQEHFSFIKENMCLQVSDITFFVDCKATIRFKFSKHIFSVLSYSYSYAKNNYDTEYVTINSINTSIHFANILEILSCCLVKYYRSFGNNFYYLLYFRFLSNKCNLKIKLHLYRLIFRYEYLDEDYFGYNEIQVDQEFSPNFITSPQKLKVSI